MQWNPRFSLYARSRGMTEDAVLAADAASYPGGKMAGFIVWVSQQVAAYKADGHAMNRHGDRPSNSRHFTEWLEDRFAVRMAA